MSEPEKKSGGGAGGSSVVLVEQSAASRHKQPFRPTELQEQATDLHHKRSRAPAVPSVTEELKDNANTDTKNRRESESAMSSEKQKQSIAKKLSSATKRRTSSPESIILAKLEHDTKRGTVTPPPQPIPAQVSVASAEHVAGKTSVENKEDDDSITDEVADLRTAEVTKKSSEWIDDPQETSSSKSKAVSWQHRECLDKVKVQEMKSACVLERKSSIGPCFRSSAPFGRPSGIAISLPNKLSRPVGDVESPQSLINISVSKEPSPPSDWPGVRLFGSLRGKLSNMTEKLKEVMNA